MREVNKILRKSGRIHVVDKKSTSEAPMFYFPCMIGLNFSAVENRIKVQCSFDSFTMLN